MLGQVDLFPPDVTLPLRRRVQLRPVSVADARHMLEKWHYLHRTRTGRQINYAVLIDGVIDGVITYAYPMMSAPIVGVPSDEVLEFARLYLHSNMPHTASCAVAQSLTRIKADWVLKFPDSKPPRLIVSWSDCMRHKGTIYKASNFQWLRRSDGKRGGNHGAHTKRGKRIIHDDMRHEKDCWIYWLKERAKQQAKDEHE